MTYGQGGGKMNNIVRELRIAEKKSQTDFANIIGISRQSLSAIENGGVPSGPTMLKIAKRFQKPVEEIFFIAVVNHVIQ